MENSVNKRIERIELPATGPAPQTPAVASCLGNLESLIDLFLAEQQLRKAFGEEGNGNEK